MKIFKVMLTMFLGIIYLILLQTTGNFAWVLLALLVVYRIVRWFIKKKKAKIS